MRRPSEYATYARHPQGRRGVLWHIGIDCTESLSAVHGTTCSRTEPGGAVISHPAWNAIKNAAGSSTRATDHERLADPSCFWSCDGGSLLRHLQIPRLQPSRNSWSN